MKLLDKVEIVDNITDHPFDIGDVVVIFRIFSNNTYDVCNRKGDCWRVKASEIKINSMKQLTEVVINTAKRLCKAQNKVTTLEIKTEVMKTHSQYHWTQATVSAIMDDAYTAGIFTFTDTVTGGNRHRIYSETKTKTMKKKNFGIVKVVPGVSTKLATTPAKKSTKVTTKSISRTKALELMENNRGHFFTAVFIAKKGEERTINCQYLKDQTYSRLGYVKVKEAIKAKADPKDCIRQINLQTLKSLKIAGNSYKVK